MTAPKQARRSLTAIAALFLSAATIAHAEPGITADTILIGQSAALTGGPAEEVKQATAGARAYFDSINRKGGIFGRKIALESLDDGFDPKRTVENTKALIRDKNAFALFLYRGTPTVEAVMPLLKEAKVPLVAPVTGATSLHEPMPRYVFNVRTKYRDEVDVLVRQISSMGMQKLAVAAPSDSFGEDTLTGVKDAIREYRLPEPTIVRFDRATTAMEPTAKTMMTAQPQAVLMFCTAKPCDALLREYRKQGGFQPVFTLSNVSSKSFIQGLGDLSRGLGMTQVFPSISNMAMPVVKEFRELVKDKPELADSYPALEGFISAKVLVEGLRRAGNNPTREGLVGGLETLKGTDFGGMSVNYGPNSRGGFSYVDVTVIGRNGAVVR